MCISAEYSPVAGLGKALYIHTSMGFSHSPLRQGQLSPFYRRRNWGSGRLSHMDSKWAGIGSCICLTLNVLFSHNTDPRTWAMMSLSLFRLLLSPRKKWAVSDISLLLDFCWIFNEVFRFLSRYLNSGFCTEFVIVYICWLLLVVILGEAGCWHFSFKHVILITLFNIMCHKIYCLEGSTAL